MYELTLIMLVMWPGSAIGKQEIILGRYDNRPKCVAEAKRMANHIASSYPPKSLECRKVK